MKREKSISVRFAAVGGQQLKAEMRDIGQAGRTAMSSVTSGVMPASDSLENFSQAAAQARLQLEAIAAKASATASALRTTSQATTAMQSRVNVSTGVSTPTGMSAAEMIQQGQALDDLRARFNPLFATIRNYRAQVSEIRAAHLEGAVSADEMSAAIAKLRGEALTAIDRIKGITAAQKESAAAAKLMADAQKAAADAAARQAQQLSDLRARYNPLYGAVRDYRAELVALREAHRAGAISADEMAAAQLRLREASEHRIAVLKGEVDTFEQVARSERGATLRMTNMAYQLNDVGVSLAGGMPILMVMAQQGTQIAQIYAGQGGVNTALKDTAGLLKAIPGPAKLAIAAIAAGAVAVMGLRHEINETGKIVVSFGDTAKAVFQVLGDRIGNILKPVIDRIVPWFSAAWDLVILGVKVTGNFIINGITAAIVGVRDAVSAVPLYFEAAFLNAVGKVQDAMGMMLDAVHGMLQGAAEGLNSVFGTSLSAPAGLKAMASSLYKSGSENEDAAFEKIAEAFDRRQESQEEIARIMGRDPMGDFFDDVAAQARKNALEREKKKKGGGKEAKAEKDAVADLIEQLQRELAVLRETDPVKKKMLEYSKQLEGATEAERAQVLALVETLDKAKNGWEAVGRSLAEYAEESTRLGDDMGSVFVNAFGAADDAFAEFVKTGKLNMSDLVNSMIADLARLTSQQFVTGPLAGMLGNWFTGMADPLAGALQGAGLDAIPSFEGGGNTGYGPRSGGVDGKGGFLALLHRNEDVYDRTKGQRGGQSVHVTVGIDPKRGNISAFVEERAGAMVQAGLESYDRHVLPRSVKQHMKDPRGIG